MSSIEISSLPEYLQGIARQCDKNGNGKIDSNEISVFQSLSSSKKDKLAFEKRRNSVNTNSTKGKSQYKSETFKDRHNDTIINNKQECLLKQPNNSKKFDFYC